MASPTPENIGHDPRALVAAEFTRQIQSKA